MWSTFFLCGNEGALKSMKLPSTEADDHRVKKRSGFPFSGKNRHARTATIHTTRE
jgi:hypothetical protein